MKTPAIEIRKAGNDVLVHDPGHDKVHVLNATAAYVLERCNGTCPSTEIARSLSEATGADAAAVTHDVEAIVREFEALQLLVTSTAWG